MTTYYQIGPLFQIYYNLNSSGAENVQNEAGASFRPGIFYDNARIPEDAPSGDDGGKGDNVLRPSGFRKGDNWALDSGQVFFDTSTTNPFIIGWGHKIADGFWVEIDLPFDWSAENYPDAFRQLDGKWDSERRVDTGERNPDGSIRWHRVFVWCVSLEFTVSIPVPVKREIPPVLPREKVMPARETFDAGEIIPYSKGARRIRGVTIHAKGNESGEELLADASYGNWSDAYGYALDPTEVFYPNTVWMEGTEAWNATAGTVLDALEGDLEFVFYPGSSTQLQDPEIVADKGADRTPAHRGLIYIRFTGVNLAPFGNRRPSTEVEFLREDGQRITVAGVLEDVGRIGDVTVACDGIEDMADGVVFEGMDPRGILEKYRDQYGYRIIDGDPVRIIRRAVGESLVIDRELVASDFVDKDAQDPVVTIERRDETDLPSQIVLTYVDKSQNYQSRPQYARLPRFPITVTQSGKSEDQDTEFIVTAVEALSIAYDMLYRMQAQRFGAKATLIPARADVEEGDVLRAPTAQGQFVFDVARRTLQADDAVELELSYLLAERGATLTADAGDFLASGVDRPCYFPQTINVPSLVAVTDGRLWTPCDCEDVQNVTSVSTAIPTRISHRFTAPTPGGQGPIAISYDSDYVYAAFAYSEVDDVTAARIMRISKADRSTTVLVLPDLREPGEVADSFVFSDIAIADGVLALVTAGYNDPFITPATAPLRLWLIDLSDFTASGISTTDIATPGSSGELQCQGIAGIAGALVFEVRNQADTSTTIYRYRISSGELDSITAEPSLGRATAAQGAVYFMPRGGVDSVDGIKVLVDDLSTQAFDVTTDPGVTAVKQFTKAWATATNLYFLANNSIGLGGGTLNAPYVAVRALGDLTVGTGRDLTFDFDNTAYSISGGATDGTWHYIEGQTAIGAEQPHGPGCLLRVNSNLSAALFYPVRQAAPQNDAFPGASILLNASKSYFNQYATKQDGEPDHAGNEGGHSIWWTFTAPADGFVTVNVTGADVVAVYVGASFPALAEVASSDSGGPVTFPAYAGERYRIAIDGLFDPETLSITFGSGTIALASLNTTQNDDFANAITISAGQTRTGKNRFATKEAGEPDHGGNAGGKSLWWKFTATEDTTIQITSTCDFPHALAVYTEGSPAGVGGLIEVGSDTQDGATPNDFAAWRAFF